MPFDDGNTVQYSSCSVTISIVYENFPKKASVKKMQAQETRVMRRIKQISVKDLFGMFHHVIPLNVEDRITIMHGPNGFGKTIMLRLLSELFSNKSSTLRTIPFSEFRVDFEDGSNFWVTKMPSDTRSRDPKQPRQKISFHAIIDNVEQEPFVMRGLSRLPRNVLLDMPRSIVGRLVPELDRVGPDHWHNNLTGEDLSLEDVIERFGERLPLPTDMHNSEKVPEWLSELRCSIAIRFIETQRLLNPTKGREQRVEYENRMKPTVAAYSEDLAENIKSTLAASAALSQSLDRTFPSRVVNFTKKRDFTEEALRSKLAELEDKRLSLTKVGLLDQESNDAVQIYQTIDERTKSILSVYVEDVEKKLAIFDEIAKKIELLTRIINKRFSYKQIEISKEHGFIFKTSKGATLSPTDLSSGEQHELVLFYELLFKVAPGSLILIDEPEISLHVAWQMDFLKDLKDITEVADLDVLIATHSPDIIGNRWDLTVQLGGVA